MCPFERAFMLNIASTDKIQVSTSTADTLHVHAHFVDYRANGALESPVPRKLTLNSAETHDIVLSPADGTRHVKTLFIRNVGASANAVTVLLSDNGTARELFTQTVDPGFTLCYMDGVGFSYTGEALRIGGIGTPNATSQSLTAGVANVLTGTLVALPTNSLRVGSRFRFNMNFIKTAAGTASWQLDVRWGQSGTSSDSVIALWTSGTNTAAVDQATCAIEVVIAAVGASATANCIAMYVNTLTHATGLGRINMTPTSTASFNSTLSNPYLHVDVTPGTGAVMTAVASAERLA